MWFKKEEYADGVILFKGPIWCRSLKILSQAKLCLDGLSVKCTLYVCFSILCAKLDSSGENSLLWCHKGLSYLSLFNNNILSQIFF